MAENLNYSDNETIGYCYGSSNIGYDHKDNENCAIYGRLYMWWPDARQNSPSSDTDPSGVQGICPDGWHLPSSREWWKLINAIGGEYVAVEKLKANSRWNSDGNGTDYYDFSALPGGVRNPENGRFNDIGDYAVWWTASESGSSYGYRVAMSYDNKVYVGYAFSMNGYSVRCVKGAAESEPAKISSSSSYSSAAESSSSSHSSSSSEVSSSSSSEDPNFTDTRNGQMYRKVKIGNFVWLGKNLNYETGYSWCYGDDESNCEIYGRLYDWNTAKVACPRSWHLANTAEWRDLIEAAGGHEFAGKKLKSETQWDGTNDYGWSAVPSGILYNTGAFYGGGDYSYWWSATESIESNFADRMGMSSNYESVSDYDNLKSYGLSVRCVQN